MVITPGEWRARGPGGQKPHGGRQELALRVSGFLSVFHEREPRSGLGRKRVPGEACGRDPERQDLPDTSPRSHWALGFMVPSGPSGMGLQGTCSALLVPRRPIPPAPSPGRVDASAPLAPRGHPLCSASLPGPPSPWVRTRVLSVSASLPGPLNLWVRAPLMRSFDLSHLLKGLVPERPQGRAHPVNLGMQLSPWRPSAPASPWDGAASPRLCTDVEG